VAVKTIWPIEYACGHRDDRDLSAKKADERAGYAKWLASKDCTDCWRANQGDNNDTLPKQEWLAQKRAEERAAVEEWEQKTDMSALSGSEKALDWGRRCRHEMLSGAYEALVVNGDMPEGQYIEVIERPARLIDRASWWIDNRGAEPEDVRELVEAAQSTSAVTTENDL
jgi:hypothetical protein